MAVSCEIIEPEGMSGAALDRVVDDLFAVHERIFGGVSKDEFASYVVRSPADRTRILVCSDTATGRAVGYAAVHFFSRVVDGAACTVMRAEVGLERAYRGQCAFNGFIVREALRARATRRGRMYFLGSLVHPSSYVRITRHASEFWPHPERELQAETRSLMLQLADACGVKAPHGDDPLVRPVGWITRDRPADRARWAASTDARARYFVQHNPRYGEGFGLLTVIPMTMSVVLCGARDAFREVISRRAAALGAAIRARAQVGVVAR